MTQEEKDRFLKEIKQMIVIENGQWSLNIEMSDFDLRHECRNLEEYKESFNYLVGQLMRDRTI